MRLLGWSIIAGIIIIPIGSLYLDPLLFGKGNYWIASTVEYCMFVFGVWLGKVVYS